jgi:hypothetical protein
MHEPASRRRAIAPEALPEMLARAVGAAEARGAQPGDRGILVGFKRSAPPVTPQPETE